MIALKARASLHQWARQHIWQYPQHSRSYRKWRRGFVRDRLTLAFWIAILAQVFLEVIDVFLVIPLENWSQSSNFQIDWAESGKELPVIAISAFCLCLGLIALKYSRRSPARLLPWFSLATLILPEQFHWFSGIEEVGVNAVEGMAIVFWCQAILVPVQWRVHLLSHGMTLLCFVAFGLQNWPENIAETDPAMVMLGAGWFILYSAMIIAVANVLVWYTERLLWKEFSLREQLQTFLQTVSWDLRSPIQQNQQMLNQLKSEIHPPIAPNTAITLAPATVEMLLSRNQQQLTLLSHLLEAAHPERSPDPSPDHHDQP